MQISVIDPGYVGFATAACLAQIGHDVFCSESDQKKLGMLPGRLRFGSTEEAIGWGDAIICVRTTPLANGDADLSAIEVVARMSAKQASGYQLIVEKSTGPVQTEAQLRKHLSVHNTNGLKYDVASHPEFLREGPRLRTSSTRTVLSSGRFAHV